MPSCSFCRMMQSAARLSVFSLRCLEGIRSLMRLQPWRRIHSRKRVGLPKKVCTPRQSGCRVKTCIINVPISPSTRYCLTMDDMFTETAYQAVPDSTVRLIHQFTRLDQSHIYIIKAVACRGNSIYKGYACAS